MVASGYMITQILGVKNIFGRDCVPVVLSMAQGHRPRELLDFQFGLFVEL